MWGEGDPDSAVRLAALLGLTEGGGTVVLAGPAAAQAWELRKLTPEVAVVAMAGCGAGIAGAGWDRE